ncbi:hypothetical protein D3C71_2078670 [compost metagenome]
MVTGSSMRSSPSIAAGPTEIASGRMAATIFRCGEIASACGNATLWPEMDVCPPARSSVRKLFAPTNDATKRLAGLL